MGSTVLDSASGRTARVRRIATMDGDLQAARIGQAVVLQLDRDLDIARGAVLTTPDEPVQRVTRLHARLFWMAETPFDPGRRLLLRTATDLVPLSAASVTAKLELETLGEIEAGNCGQNDVVLASLTLGSPTALDRFADHKSTGALVLVDAITGATLAGGAAVTLHEAAGADTSRFHLTTAMLAEGVCAVLEPTSIEFRSRAAAVADILAAAGVDAEVDEPTAPPHRAHCPAA